MVLFDEMEFGVQPGIMNEYGQLDELIWKFQTQDSVASDYATVRLLQTALEDLRKVDDGEVLIDTDSLFYEVLQLDPDIQKELAEDIISGALSYPDLEALQKAIEKELPSKKPSSTKEAMEAMNLWWSLPVANLKFLLKDKGLKVGGTKPELIERLKQDWLRNHD